ncbi:MAG: Nif3-like dinuclear metal center hexameric protein [Methanospirillum sp.]|uniref:Nif3-like dinuclear metal center hexameric protein n=1 Tax=Methanospirillum sp. TaxID=45200 RepID=UPI0023742975|nr:Nif3-like dinuclear metal center hexameric protein [Methanospirillum sp.]MDD1727888.1 Nif3-like dinuclear metal center hexameric protein [Methanospirillum sp.]
MLYRDDIIRDLEISAPPELAEPFDQGKIGLIVEGKQEINRICTCLDVTVEVVRQAISLGADLLIAHHTPFWYPLSSIKGSDAALLRELLSNRINVYVMHTNYDLAVNGVNHCLAGLLGLGSIRALSLGVVGDCHLTPSMIADHLGTPLRIWGTIREIRRLAVVGGSGFDMEIIREAAAAGAEAFLSAELKHSVARASPLPLIESTHYALEAPAMRILAGRYGWTYIDDPPVMSSYP